MKSYTDLEQSKKLAKILPLESADMHYNNVSIKGINYVDEYRAELMDYNNAIKVLSKYTINPLFEIVPCWSLASLLNILESEIDGEEGETYQLNIEKDGTWWNVWYREIYDEANPIETSSTEELIDACYEMIIKLHEQKLL